VGATPTPATNLREVIRQSGRNPDVSKHVGSDDWSVTSTSHHFWTRSSISPDLSGLSAGGLSPDESGFGSAIFHGM
jgi:hypothetical protein